MIVVHIGFQDRWQVKAGNYLTGAGFIGEKPCDVLASLTSVNEPGAATSLVDFVGRLNGNFALIVQPQLGSLFAAVDRVRSTPLYYYSAIGCFLLSDDPEWILERIGDRTMSSQAMAEFVLAGYVTGGETLYANLKQLQAGESIWVTEDGGRIEVRKDRYFVYEHTPPVLPEEMALLCQHDAIVDRAINRLVHYAQGRTIVLPLSGGLDSRLIALKLRNHGFKDVLCYTYGLPGNAEAEVSERVASELGFRWEFVPYSGPDWASWAKLPEWSEYSRFAHRVVSLPVFQDWPAVRHLVRNGIIPAGSVVVPGHSADFLAGSHLGPQFFNGQKFTSRKLHDSIWAKHYTLNDLKQLDSLIPDQWSERSSLKQKVGNFLLKDERTMNSEQAASLFESWDWQERQAKFIINAVRVYEFFGLDWWLPLWDAELMSFWAAIPHSYRENTVFYNRYLAWIQENMGIGIPIPSRGAQHGYVRRKFQAFLDRMGFLDRLKQWKRALLVPDAHAEYYGHPLAWYGILDFPSFSAHYTGRESVNTFLVRQFFQSQYINRLIGE